MRPVALLIPIACAAPLPALAQTPQSTPAPSGPVQVISTAAVQQWQYRQEWQCSNTPTTSQDAVARMRDAAASLGSEGWEFVAFSPLLNVSQQGECFFAMYKKPVPR